MFQSLASHIYAMQRIMLAAGVPEEFLAHSAQAAGCACRREQGWSDDEILDFLQGVEPGYPHSTLPSARRRQQSENPAQDGV